MGWNIIIESSESRAERPLVAASGPGFHARHIGLSGFVFHARRSG
jgi:hypothetical protein